MRTLMKHTARAGLVGVSVAVLGLAAAATASGDPVTWLPDADLVCGTTTVQPDQWVAIAPSDTLWITGTALAGHYVILADTHYVVSGYADKPPASYDGMAAVDSRTWGAKRALATSAIRCDFVSRWGAPGDADTFSVVGPITIARVSG